MATGRVGIRPYSGVTSTTTTTTAVSIDTDAQAFITATAITDTTQINAVNNLVLDLKGAGIWTKMKALYPMVGGTATTHKWNLKDPRDLDVAYRLVFSGGWIHSSTGALPNGTTGYANTYCATSNMGLNSIHHSFYSRTNATSSGTDMGAAFSGYASVPSSYAYLKIRQANNTLTSIFNTGSSSPVSNNNSLGFFVGSRTTVSLTKTYKNNTTLLTNTTVTTTTSNLPYFIGAQSNADTGVYTGPNSFSNREFAFASIGDGLTDLESNLFYQIVEKYQYALGRNVNANQTFYFNRNYSNETNAFIFNGAISDATQQSAINTLVNDLKAAGIWTKMKALYPMVGGTALAHKFNLANPIDSDAAFRLTFNGGWTHNSLGAKPNGVDGYANTYLTTPETYFTLANHHISYYNVTNSSGVNGVNGKTEIAAGSTNNWANLSVGNGANMAFGGNLGGTVAASTNLGTGSDPRGFVSLSRTSSTLLKSYRNGVLSATQTGAASRLPYTGDYNIGCNYFSDGTTQRNNFSDRQAAFISFGSGLTDMESSILYQIVEKFQYALGRNVNTALPFYYNSNYSNETNAFIVNGSISDATQISAVDTLVKDLKSAGIWTKMKAVYPMVGGTALAHKFNLVNPIDATSAYVLTFNGGWTHTSTGATPNGTTGYANTNLIPASVLSTNSTHISYYSRTDNDTGIDMGVNSNNSNGRIYTFIRLGNTFGGRNNNTTSGEKSIANTNGLGHYINNRIDSANMKLVKNGNTTTLALTSNGLDPVQITIGAMYNISSYYFGSKQCAFSSIGDGLTDLESSTLYQIVEKFQYTLGRNVNATLPFYYNNAYGIEANAYILENSVTNYSTLPVTSGLIMAYDAGMTSSYPGSGTAIYDISSNSYTGTFYNGPVFNSSYGGNIVFDGTNDYIYSGAFPSVANNFTIDIWCRPVANSPLQIYSQTTSGFNPPYLSNHRFILSPDNLGNGAGISIGSNGINVIEHGASTFPAPLVYYTTISTTLFTNITIVYTNKVPSLYINGVFVKTGIATSAATTYCSFSQLGGMAYGYFAGALSSIKWYSKSLSATEITQNYNVSKSRYGLS